MIADQMPILAARTADQRRALMVCLFRDVMGAAVVALLAGEGELVRGLLCFARGDFGSLLRFGRGGSRCGLSIGKRARLLSSLCRLMASLGLYTDLRRDRGALRAVQASLRCLLDLRYPEGRMVLLCEYLRSSSERSTGGVGIHDDVL